MTSYGLTDEARALRERVKKFINEEVIPAEPILRRENAESEHALENLKRSLNSKVCGRWGIRKRSAAAACRSWRLST